MAQLRQDYSEFFSRDAEVVVVGPDDTTAFANYWKKENLPFVGVPDPEHTVLQKYGQEVKIFKLGRMPAQAIIDKSGTVRFIHYGDSMRDIPANRELLQLLDEINHEKIKTRH